MSKNNYQYKSLLVLFLLLSIGCKDDDFGPDAPTQAEPYAITNDGFGCLNYAYLDFLEENESIQELWVYANTVFYTNFNLEIKAYSIPLNRTITLVEGKVIRQVDYDNGKLFFCTWSGIYSVNVNDLSSFIEVAPYTCQSIAVTDRDSIYFTGYNIGAGQYFTNTNLIYKLDGNGVARRFSELLERGRLYSFSMLDNGSIIAYNEHNTDEFYRFDASGVLTHVFNADNSPIGRGNFESEVWTKVVGDRLIVALKNGLTIPKLIEWNEATMEWYDYLHREVIDEQWGRNDPKVLDLVRPSYTDLAVDSNHIYVTTTLAGCQGIQRFNFRQGAPFSLADIEIIRDEDLVIGNCVQGMQIDVPGAVKYIYSQRGLMILTQCE